MSTAPHPSWCGRLRRALAIAIAVVITGGCGGDDGVAGPPPATSKGAVIVADAASPVALVSEPDGGFLFGERLTGAIRHVDAEDRLDPNPVAVVDTAGNEDDQRGLLGITRGTDGTVYVSWTRRIDGRLVVGRLDTDTPRSPVASPTVIWVGPVSADQANGGGLAIGSDDAVLIGVGDLLAPGVLADDLALPNRKVLKLDPHGPPDQVPTVMSTGWNNPFAIVTDENAVTWVADNAAGDNPERMGRADQSAERGSDLDRSDGQIAPSGLVSLGSGRFGVCGYVSHRLDEVHVTAGRAASTGRVLADDCWTSAALLTDGRLVTATLDQILAFN